MQIAQRLLYEGVEIGSEGAAGLITYMRTDSHPDFPGCPGRRSPNTSATHTGPITSRPSPGSSRNPKRPQDAHEAIRPTDVNRTPAMLKPFLTPDQFKISTPSSGSASSPSPEVEAALFDRTDVKIGAGRCLFQATGDVLKFPGFLKGLQRHPAGRRREERRERGKYPRTGGKRGFGPAQAGSGPGIYTQPPPRYTEATLIKALEEKGIGRPSTYATIVSIIQNREYVTKDEGKFQPTETGEIVVDLLVANFPDLFNYEYTANMETQLDLIEQGTRHWLDELRNFYQPFAKTLATAEKQMRNLKAEMVPTERKMPGVRLSHGHPAGGTVPQVPLLPALPECKSSRDLGGPAAETPAAGEAGEEETCDKCGAKMVLRKGRFGSFLACSAYPQVQEYPEDPDRRRQGRHRPAIVDRKLPPVAGNPGRPEGGVTGKFTSCSGYPTCKYIKKNTLSIPCPEEGCGGEIVARRGGRGRTFYGCSKYPQCDFTSGQKPVAQACPACGNAYLVEKDSKKSGRFLQCPVKTCGHTVELPEKEPGTPS